jgi:hypothetical protein
VPRLRAHVHAGRFEWVRSCSPRICRRAA